MEDSSQGSRRARPESSSSRETRMTPQSSNSSSAHLPSRSTQNTTARGGPGASLLQERLRERKVETARQSRRRSVDMSAGGERGVQSSPVKGSSVREERRPSSSGVNPGKGMGVKQIEEQVSTLHKQNFDLKLELYHRRQRQEALEARLEAAEKQIEEQRELQDVNEQLLAELEKRDLAVEEAVGIIVDLEDKVERLMQEREMVRTVDAKYESGYFLQSHNELSNSPPEVKPTRPTLNTRAIARMPSFLSEQSEGAEALRSLYLPNNHSYSEATLPKLAETAGSEGMDSPRLSLLSTSSFLSIYGEKQLALVAADDEEGDLPARRHRTSSSVEKWIDERPTSTAPLRPSPAPRPDVLRKNQYLSINDVLESPLQRMEKLMHTLEKHNSRLVPIRQPEQSRAEEKRKARELLRRGFTDKTSFEHAQTLPPTPDTISTGTLKHYKYSNDTLCQETDDTKEGAFLNSTATFPVPNPSYNAYESAISMRPRSAGETITSRREGHGWDTETQEDLTETGSVSSTASRYSRQKQSRQPRRVLTPDLFTFNSFDNQDDPRDWGRDVMFNDSAARLPAHTARRYDTLRRSSMVENPRSDDTIVGPNHRRNARQNDQSSNQYGIIPIDTSPRPHPPDRRSSLSATSKLRNGNPGTNPAAATAGSPASKEKGPEKKSRLAMPKFFTRSETTPVLNTFQPSPASQRPNRSGGRSQSYFGDSGVGFEDDEMARATPPPIKRNRTNGSAPAYRPSSAGTGIPNGGRKGNSFAYDGVGEDGVSGKRRSVDLDPHVGVEVEEPVNGGKGGRKWLGFGRTGSLRRA